MAKKEKNKTKVTEKKPSQAKERLPILLDFTFSVSSLVIFLIGIITMALSMFAGVDVLTAAMRGCVAMFGLGIPAWLINFHISQNALESIRLELAKAKEAQKNNSGSSTIEFNA